MSFSSDEIAEFRIEAQELLDQAETSLLALDQGGDIQEHYDAIFRALHSIKGAAGMMEMTSLQVHMHQLETLFVELKGSGRLEKAAVDFFLRGADGARTLLAGGAIDFKYEIEAKLTPNPEPSVAPMPLPMQTPTSTPAPAAKASAAATAAAKISTVRKHAAHAGRVVVVDDERDLVDLLTEILEASGFEVHGTHKPEEVSELVDRVVPDVVFTDLMMPVVSGLDLLNSLSKSHPDLPVIFISGQVSKEFLLKAISVGVHGVIEKPFDVVKVAEAAKRAVRTHKLQKLVTTSVNLLMYQFSDLDQFLASQGKDDVRAAIKNEIQSILDQRRLLNETKKAS